MDKWSFGARSVETDCCGISKMGDRYLRHLLVIGATAVIRYTRCKPTAVSIWASRLLDRKPARLVTVAVANKLARIGRILMVRGRQANSSKHCKGGQSPKHWFSSRIVLGMSSRR